MEFLYNRQIISDFGEQIKLISAESDFTLLNGTRFLALGYKQPIRGKIHNSYRPGYILIDDFETHTTTNKKIAQEKLKYVSVIRKINITFFAELISH